MKEKKTLIKLIEEDDPIIYEKSELCNISTTISAEKSPIEIGGIVQGNVSNASTIYGYDKFCTPKGHGFAAEQANHLHDKIQNMDFFGEGKVQLVGEEIDPSTGHIIKNGADRIVNGVAIQTKYCNSGGKCIEACFENGKFRYFNPDGTPMQIEVPSDMYDSAVQAMEHRIQNGEIKGISDPAEAKNIVRKGSYTYKQAKNIAKAGNIDSLKFDAQTGAITAAYSGGISALVSFATSIWNGDEPFIALKNSVMTGLKVGGTTFVTAILSSQISKAGMNSVLVGGSEAIVNVIGPKASAMLVNAFRSGTNIYGAAAMKSAAKLLRGNTVTAAVSVVVLSAADVTNIFRGRISGKQLFKNVANTATSVAGGTAGWVGGATIGASIGSVIPIIGTAVGGFVGGFVGSVAAGTVAGKASNALLDEYIEDDADEMVRIIEHSFQELATDYLLNQKEAEHIVSKLSDKLSGGTLKDMFASSNRKEFANNLLVPIIENETLTREKISVPNEEQMQTAIRQVLEEIADSTNIEESVEENECENSLSDVYLDNSYVNNIEYRKDIEEIIHTYTEGCAFSVLTTSSASTKRIRNAISFCQNEISESDIVTLIDITVWNNMKCGMVFTYDSAYKINETKITSKIVFSEIKKIRQGHFCIIFTHSNGEESQFKVGCKGATYYPYDKMWTLFTEICKCINKYKNNYIKIDYSESKPEYFE